MEKSVKLIVSHKNNEIVEALKMADVFISSLNLGKTDNIYLHLLAEETLRMIQAMTDDFKAHFWIEADQKEYRVRATVSTEIDLERKQEFLSVSTSGKNNAVKGFMGKIREIIENGLLNYDEVMKLSQEYGGGYVNYGFMGADMNAASPMIDVEWSLQNYRTALGEEAETEKPAKEAWDELEKSIVASLADDVIVGVKSDHVDLTIRRKITI